MITSGDGFELYGATVDETRLLVHRGCGYSIPIPGHPILGEPIPDAKPTYDVVALMVDLPMELGFRIDILPVGVEPSALAHALALAYGTNRATEPPRIRPLLGEELAHGADAGVTCIYDVRDVIDAGDDDRTMEQLEVVIRSHSAGLWALYYTVRYPVPGLNPVQWSHFRAALRGHQHWNPSSPQSTAPQLFPASTFAQPAVSLELTEQAWAEARSKAADIGLLADVETQALIKALIAFSRADAPPTMAMPESIVYAIQSRVRMVAPSVTAETLLRNLDDVKSLHDLRAWIWQCIWAIGNRESL